MTAQLSRERLEEISEDGFVAHGEVKVMARMLLAGMDSEPVYQLSESWNGQPFSGWKDCTKEDFDAAVPCGCERMRRVLYAAPPAPVAVPDEWRMMCGEWRDEAVSIHDASGLIVSGVDANVAGVIVEAHNACRAAMLKAGPVTGWIKCSEQMPPLNNGQMWIYSPTRGVQFMFALAASGEYYDTCDSEEDITDATHWMPISTPASPDQEV